jgi:hypothetical protein
MQIFVIMLLVFAVFCFILQSILMLISLSILFIFCLSLSSTLLFFLFPYFFYFLLSVYIPITFWLIPPFFLFTFWVYWQKYLFIMWVWIFPPSWDKFDLLDDNLLLFQVNGRMTIEWVFFLSIYLFFYVLID